MSSFYMSGYFIRLIVPMGLMLATPSMAQSQSSGAAGPSNKASVALQWNGSGCAKLDEHLDVEGGSITFQKDFGHSFKVKKGNGLRLGDSRKNCSLIVTANGTPQQIAVKIVELEGAQSFPSSMKLDLSIDVASQGQSQSKSYALKTESGPTFKISQVLDAKDQAWSVCRRGLNINIKQRLDGTAKAPDNGGEADLKSIKFVLETKSCK
ncbi:MAG: DUF4360 domain-containing protein [Chitinophagaceae bacterium]|nr:DUF4360 domain-containing protein [Oligoflexus sp.]